MQIIGRYHRHGRTQRDKRMKPDTSWLAVEIAVEANDPASHQCGGNAKTDFRKIKHLNSVAEITLPRPTAGLAAIQNAILISRTAPEPGAMNQ